MLRIRRRKAAPFSISGSALLLVRAVRVTPVPGSLLCPPLWYVAILGSALLPVRIARVFDHPGLHVGVFRVVRPLSGAAATPVRPGSASSSDCIIRLDPSRTLFRNSCSCALFLLRLPPPRPSQPVTPSGLP